MQEDDLDSQAVTEKLDQLKRLVKVSSKLKDEQKTLAAEHLQVIWEAIKPPRDKLRSSINTCWGLFFNTPELADALEEVASLFGVPIEKRPENFPRPNAQKRAI